MARVLRRSPALLEAAIAVTLALDVVLTSFGSSSVQGLRSIGSPGRWVALVALLALAGRLARRHRHGSPAAPLARTAALVAALVGVALLSAAWSAAPKLSLERAATFAVATLALALAAYAAEVRPELAWTVVRGLVAGAAAVAAGGVLVWVFERQAAVQPGTGETVARWKGIGENPNTVSLLCAVVLPAALALGLRAASRREAALAWVSVLALVLTILASQSRGAVAASVIGVALYAVARPARGVERVSLAAAGVVVLLAGAFISAQVINRISPPPPPPATAVGGTTTTPGGGQGPGGSGAGLPRRSVETISDSGRLAAWRGALRQADLRPVLGYGFGTEERVFLSGRYRIFQGSRPENSYLGLYMQLGAVGLLLLLAVFVEPLRSALGAVLRRREIGAVLLATTVAGLTLAVVQSYLYSVGNVAMVSFWAALLLAPAVRA